MPRYEQVEVSWQELGTEGIKKRHYHMTPPVDFVIPNTGTGAAVDPVELPAPCKGLLIACGNCGGIPAAATISAQVCPDNQASSPVYTLYTENDPTTQWSEDTPSSGNMFFYMSNIGMVRRIRFILSQAATAEVRIKVYGIDGVGNIDIRS